MLNIFKKTHIILGRTAEQKAYKFLKKQGLRLLTKNYYCPFGEIDLIMQDRAEIIFVEVRLRNNRQYGSACESIDKYKQKRIVKSAMHYLSKKNWHDCMNCRFDVIGFSKSGIDWIKDAFPYE